MKKHGYVPTVGISVHKHRPYDSWPVKHLNWRVGLYGVCVEFSWYRLSVLSRGRIKASYEWHFDVWPIVRKVTKDNACLWDYEKGHWTQQSNYTKKTKSKWRKVRN